MTALAPAGSGDSLDIALAEVTFVVIDLETTGCSPASEAITEIGAAKYLAGECQGELQTLVRPTMEIPAPITVLTGISDAMVAPAPTIGAVLPSLLEFIGTAVLVGHNVRFDVAFLDTALAAHGYPVLTNTRLDTIALSRRLLCEETSNLQLLTLARHVRAPRTPIHRALDDARATADLLHALLERAGTLGLLSLDDLFVVLRVARHHSLSKLKLAARLPRQPGEYAFRDRRGEVLHAGTATNLRARVMSYFTGNDQRDTRGLLRRTYTIDHVVHDVDSDQPPLRPAGARGGKARSRSRSPSASALDPGTRAVTGASR